MNNEHNNNNRYKIYLLCRDNYIKTFVDGVCYANSIEEINYIKNKFMTTGEISVYKLIQKYDEKEIFSEQITTLKFADPNESNNLRGFKYKKTNRVVSDGYVFDNGYIAYGQIEENSSDKMDGQIYNWLTVSQKIA